MRILALITARGGSKRIAGKNTRFLGAKPLVIWSIGVAKGIDQICDILVSTDDPTIAEIARGGGALVPWLRPAKLATDTATSVDVCLHALDWYEAENGVIDGLLLLQPTSPFRSRSTVMRGIELFNEHGRRPVIAVSPAASHPMWCFRIENQSLRPFFQEGSANLRSQDLPAAYVINGALYLISPVDLRTARSFISSETMPLVMEDPRESIDIDSEWDWQMAETVLAMTSAGLK